MKAEINFGKELYGNFVADRRSGKVLIEAFLGSVRVDAIGIVLLDARHTGIMLSFHRGNRVTASSESAYIVPMAKEGETGQVAVLPAGSAITAVLEGLLPGHTATFNNNGSVLSIRTNGTTRSNTLFGPFFFQLINGQQGLSWKTAKLAPFAGVTVMSDSELYYREEDHGVKLLSGLRLRYTTGDDVAIDILFQRDEFIFECRWR